MIENCRRFFKAWPKLALFLLSALIVTAIFPDVIFNGTTISMLDQFGIRLQRREIHHVYPEKSSSHPSTGYYDTDGGALQAEPAMQFLKYSISNGQSPYWNPFSGTGSFGPETMVDIKFSPVSLATVILGGSNLAFHFVMLLLFTSSLFFLSRTATEFLGFSVKATIATCFIFLLNGYFTANISSNTNQTYFYFPFALFVLLRFTKNPNVKNYLCLVLGFVLPLLVTFMPTTVFMISSVVGIAIGAALQMHTTVKNRIRILGLSFSALFVAALLLSFLYLPTLKALQFTGAMNTYSQRVFFPASLLSIVSFFTAKQFFESYGPMDFVLSAINPAVIFHFGIIAGLIAALVIFSGKWRKDALLASFVLVMLAGLGRIFALPGFFQIVDHLPFLKNLGEQYCWMVVACTFPIVFGYGFAAFEKSEFKIWPAFLVALVILADLTYIGSIHGLPKPGERDPINRARAIYYIVRAIFVLASGLTILVLHKKYPLKRSLITTCLVGLIFFEMAFYLNTSRFERGDIFKNPPDFISFIKKNVGLNRVANYGTGVFPAEMGTAYQIQQIDFFTMNIFPNYFDFCQRNLTHEHGWQGIGFCVNRNTLGEPNINEAALNMLAVKYILVSRKFMVNFEKFFNDRHYPRVFEFSEAVIFQNPNAFPRIYGVSHLFQAPLTPDSQNQNAANVAFTEDAKLIEDAKAKGISLTTSTDQQPSENFNRAQILNFENTHVRAEADFLSPGILIMPDNWHPDWRAKVDGEPAYIGLVNQSFRGIALKAGHHEIELNYQPSILPLALGLTGLIAVFLGLLCFFRRKADAFIAQFLLPPSPQK